MKVRETLVKLDAAVIDAFPDANSVIFFLEAPGTLDTQAVAAALKKFSIKVTGEPKRKDVHKVLAP